MGEATKEYLHIYELRKYSNIIITLLQLGVEHARRSFPINHSVKVFHCARPSHQPLHHHQYRLQQISLVAASLVLIQTHRHVWYQYSTQHSTLCAPCHNAHPFPLSATQCPLTAISSRQCLKYGQPEMTMQRRFDCSTIMI